MQERIEALKEVNKMLRKVKSWKDGKRTMVNVHLKNSTNLQGVKFEARAVWGSPDPVVRDRAAKRSE